MHDLQGQSTDHQIGRISGRLEAVEGNVRRLEERIETKLRDLDTKIGKIHDVVTSAGGSWKAIAAIGSLIAVCGGLVAGFLQWIGHK